MKNILSIRNLTTTIALIVGLTTSLIGQAALVNGSLTGNISNNLLKTPELPNGWIATPSNLLGYSPITDNTPDVMNATSNVGVLNSTNFAATPSASPDGGTWVGIAANGNLGYEGISQTITDFVAGKQYTLSWYDANFGITALSSESPGYVQTNAFSAFLDNTLIGTGSSRALGTGWVQQTFNFTPTATSQTLTFRLASTSQSYLSLDGVALFTSNAVAAVPEPSTWLMLIIGLFLISLQFFNQKNKPLKMLSF